FFNHAMRTAKVVTKSPTWVEREEGGSSWDRFSLQPLHLHLELFSLLQRKGEGDEELRDLFQVLQAHDLDRRMHVAVGEADQRRRNTAACPEDHVGVGPAGGGDSLVLQLDLPLGGDSFQTVDDFGVMRPAVRQNRSMAHFDISVLGLTYSRVVRRVGNVDDQ